MLIRRAYLVADVPGDEIDPAHWPYTIGAVASVLAEGLTFTQPITFLVGENGSGKSTLVEAIAEAYGLDARGGRAGRKYANNRPKHRSGTGSNSKPHRQVPGYGKPPAPNSGGFSSALKQHSA